MNLLNRNLKSLVDFAYYSEFYDSELREKAEKAFSRLSIEDMGIAVAILDRQYGNCQYNAGADGYGDALRLYNSWTEGE